MFQLGAGEAGVLPQPPIRHLSLVASQVCTRGVSGRNRKRFDEFGRTISRVVAALMDAWKHHGPIFSTSM